MNITLPNGLTLDGTPELINRVARSFGYADVVGEGTYYKSDTHGYMLITDMDTRHLRNAMLKMYRTWVTNLSSETNDRDLIFKLRDGITDKTFMALLAEFVRRTR